MAFEENGERINDLKAASCAFLMLHCYAPDVAAQLHALCLMQANLTAWFSCWCIPSLQLILGRVADVATVFDDNGINIRFMNSTVEGNSVRDSMSAAAIAQQVSWI